jgi:hypothetical protein
MVSRTEQQENTRWGCCDIPTALRQAKPIQSRQLDEGIVVECQLDANLIVGGFVQAELNS